MLLFRFWKRSLSSVTFKASGVQNRERAQKVISKHERRYRDDGVRHFALEQSEQDGLHPGCELAPESRGRF